MNELPLKKIFAIFDGKTSGPNLFTGPVGLKLLNCRELPHAIFPIIAISHEFNANLVNIDRQTLSSDQLYLLDIIMYITNGPQSNNFNIFGRSPGKLGYARWLTTENRTLRVYVSTESPTDNFKLLCTYIINVYACTWFEVKTNPFFYNSPQIIYNIISNSKKLNDDRLLNIIYKVIRNNSYCLHSENILCAMLTDEDSNIRFRAARKIIQCRTHSETNVRKFIKPLIYFDATHYSNLIDNDGIWLESNLTNHISSSEFLEYISNSVPVIQFSRYPSHTQAVERHIRIVSQTAKTIVSAEARDSRIHITFMESKLVPCFISKHNFITKINTVL